LHALHVDAHGKEPPCSFKCFLGLWVFLRLQDGHFFEWERSFFAGLSVAAVPGENFLR